MLTYYCCLQAPYIEKGCEVSGSPVVSVYADVRRIWLLLLLAGMIHGS